MISTNFAPNEDWDDAWLSFRLLFQPWRWLDGKEIDEAKTKLLQKFKFQISNFKSNPNNKYQITNNQYKVFLFLTGRSALFTILQSLQLPSNSEIIVQAFTCEAVILPIVANNLMPIYCDIETKTLSMNPIELEKKITKNTKVVILQHTFGMNPAQRKIIQAIVRKHKLLLIEDIAHGYSNLEFRIKNSESIYLMSFGRSKAISSVFGGAIATNNDRIIELLNRYHAQKSFPSYFFIFRLLMYKPLAMIIKSTYDYGFGKILHKLINFLKILVPEITTKEKRGEYEKILDKAYPNALAILLLNQLRKYEQIQVNRAMICDIYNKNLKSQILNLKSLTNISLIRYPILVDQPQKVLDKASRQNIYLGNWYNQVVAPKSLDLKKVGYELGSCPVAENVCKHIINLPTNISTKEIERIVNVLI